MVVNSNSDLLSLFGLPPSRGYCAKMLRKGGFGGPVYVSAKRTHRFRRQKEGLSDCEASRSDRSFNRFSVGSFWKTNPPEDCFFWVFGGFVSFLDVPAILWDWKCYEASRLRPTRFDRLGFGTRPVETIGRGVWVAPQTACARLMRPEPHSACGRQRETCGRTKCAVGRPAHSEKERRMGAGSGDPRTTRRAGRCGCE